MTLRVGSIWPLKDTGTGMSTGSGIAFPNVTLARKNVMGRGYRGTLGRYTCNFWRLVVRLSRDTRGLDLQDRVSHRVN